MDYGINFNNHISINTGNVYPVSKADEAEDFLFESEINTDDELNIDEEIGSFKQSKSTGDCWLLSAVNSLNYSKKGREIIENAITKNEDGSYTVTLKGVKKSVTFTPAEIENAKNSGMYSSGDDDVLLLEMGIEAMVEQVQSGDIKVKWYYPHITMDKDYPDEINPLDGGSFQDAIYLFTGKSSFSSDVPAAFDPVLNKQEQNPESVVSVVVFGGKNGYSEETIKDIDGNPVYTVNEQTRHSFSIKSVDGDNVTIVNPHDTSKEYVISRDTLKQNARQLDFYLYK